MKEVFQKMQDLYIEEMIAEVFKETLHTDLYEIPKKDLGLVALIQPLALSVGLVLWRAKGLALSQQDYELMYEASANLLHFFVMRAPVAVAMLDTTLHYQAISPQWYENPYLIDSQTDVLQHCYQEVSPYQNTRWINILNSALQGEIQRHEEDLWRFKDGTCRWMRWEVQPWYAHRNHIGGVLIYCEDITERREIYNQVEHLIKEKDELEAMAYMCPHDLQAHIRTLSSFIKLLAKDKSHQKSEQYFQFINHSLEGIKSLVQDSLLYAKVKTMALEKQEENLNEIFELALSSLKDVAEQRGIRIKKGQLPTLFCHGHTMRQVFENLLSNAVKFSVGNNPVVEVSAESDDHFWHIHFKDSGVGIAPEDQEKIFQNFYRVYRDSEFPGTGLGLSFCRKAIEKHNGYITVQSTLGKGSTFTINLPKKDKVGVKNKQGKC
jgi:signal transduction histidine kinase